MTLLIKFALYFFLCYQCDRFCRFFFVKSSLGKRLGCNLIFNLGMYPQSVCPINTTPIDPNQICLGCSSSIATTIPCGDCIECYQGKLYNRPLYNIHAQVADHNYDRNKIISITSLEVIINIYIIYAYNQAHTINALNEYLKKEDMQYIL